MKLVISHGGVGTISEAIRGGRPQLICPLGWDQPVLGEKLEYLNLAGLFEDLAPFLARLELADTNDISLLHNRARTTLGELNKLTKSTLSSFSSLSSSDSDTSIRCASSLYPREQSALSLASLGLLNAYNRVVRGLSQAIDTTLRSHQIQNTAKQYAARVSLRNVNFYNHVDESSETESSSSSCEQVQPSQEKESVEITDNIIQNNFNGHVNVKGANLILKLLNITSS